MLGGNLKDIKSNKPSNGSVRCASRLLMALVLLTCSNAFTTISPSKNLVSVSVEQQQQPGFPILASHSNNNNRDIRPSKTRLVRKMIIPLVLPFLPFLPTSMTLPSNAAMGPVPQREFQKEVRGMPLAKQMATDQFRKSMVEEENRVEAESSLIYKEQGPEAYKSYMEKIQSDKRATIMAKRQRRKDILDELVFEDHVDPYRSLKGQAILYQHDYDIDLYKVPGTEQEASIRLAKIRPERYEGVEEREQQNVKDKVAELESEGKTKPEILIYFKENAERMEGLGDVGRDMERLKQLRKENREKKMKKQGTFIEAPEPIQQVQIEPVQEEPPVIILSAKEQAQIAKEEAKVAKEEAKVAKTLIKTEAKVAKKLIKAEARKIKAEAKIAKEQDKINTKAAVAAAAAGAAAATAASSIAVASSIAATTGDAAASVVGEVITGNSEPLSTSDSSVPEQQPPAIIESSLDTPSSTTTTSSISNNKPIKIVTTAAILGGAGLYTFTVVKSKSKKEEEDRQRQFKLLMGDDKNDINNDDTTSPSSTSSTDSMDSMPLEPEPESTPTPVKKKLGISSIFNKKNSSRPSNLSKLTSPSLPNHGFAELLSQILTLGAPGRFPQITPPPSLNQDQSYGDLLKEQISDIMTPEQGGELFAGVVNCMLIDIIDLANSVLKESDELVVDGMNVVLDFMDYAAKLFEEVLGNVSITPVTYTGSLSKTKLEQIYGIYATSVMSSMAENAQDRVDTLQQVFSINDKKAEGILQSRMMKNMMKMMKDGGGKDGEAGFPGMEGMAEMMAGMEGGEGGMPNIDGSEDISPEDIKQSVKMMKELVESGQISDEEIKLVREQFKESYGSDISELIKAADGTDAEDELGDDGKELLDLFKTVLKE